MDTATASFLLLLRNRIEGLLAEGNVDEAIHAASAAVEKAQHALSDDFDSVDAFADALEVRADILRQVGRMDEALDDYRQAIMVLDERPDHHAQIGRLQAGLGAVYDHLGRIDEAAVAWEQAVEHFERMNPPALLDVAAMCNNLAFISRSAGDFDQAETYFLRALEISHRELGAQHEETALLCNNLGACYQAAGFYEQAREMHMMALETREALLGEIHPDTAQSHNNLALALVMTGDADAAAEHFRCAMSGFERAGEEFRDEFRAVTGNFAEFLRQSGDPAGAAELAARAGIAVGA